MPFTPWLPGMTQTATRLNLGDMIGAVVFMASRATAQSIPTGADAVGSALSWDTPDLDLLGGWASGSPTRWTAPVAGWYTLAGAAGFNSSTAGNTREVVWYQNGAGFSLGRARPVASTAIANVALTVEARTLPRLLAVGDYVQLVPAHNAGVALDTATGSYRPYMSVTYSGPP